MRVANRLGKRSIRKGARAGVRRCAVGALGVLWGAVGVAGAAGPALPASTTLDAGCRGGCARPGGVFVRAQHRVPPRFETLDGPVQALLPFAGDLVVAGSFSRAGAMETGPLARWTGSGWAPLGAPFDGPVLALAVVQGQLVAGGAFSHAGSAAAANVARWNGSGWEALGAGTNGPVQALAVQAGVVLYVGGWFDQAGGLEAHSVARWIAGNWSAVGTGVEGAVYALRVYGGALVAAGDFGTRDSGGLDLHLARFVGGAWRTLALGVDAPVFALAEYRGSLVAGGAFTAIDLVTRARGIARLTGNSWSEVGVGMTTEDGPSEVRALWVTGDELLAGGSFESAGLQRTNNIARWDGSQWNALDAGTDGSVAALAEDAGGIVAGGAFAHASDAAAGRIAAFRAGRWATFDETPVTVSDLSAVWEGEGVRLQWTLGDGAAAELRGVHVERTARPEEGGVAVTTVPLAPGARMTLLDAAPDAARPWYRIVLVDRDGGAMVAASILAPALEPGRRHSRVTSIERIPDGSIQVRYSITFAGPARLAVYDVRGRLLATLAGGPHAVGAYRAVWLPGAGAGRAPVRGAYFASLQAQGHSAARKFVLASRK